MIGNLVTNAFISLPLRHVLHASFHAGMEPKKMKLKKTQFMPAWSFISVLAKLHRSGYMHAGMKL